VSGEWLGVSDIDFSKPLSKENAKRWRNAQVKWAAAFEKYLTEGRTPAAALARAFKNFKKRLIDIYRAVANVVSTAGQTVSLVPAIRKLGPLYSHFSPFAAFKNFL
jgi:hypothetical protein